MDLKRLPARRPQKNQLTNCARGEYNARNSCNIENHGVYPPTRGTAGAFAPAGGRCRRRHALGLRRDRGQSGLCGGEHRRPDASPQHVARQRRRYPAGQSAGGLQSGPGTGQRGQAALPPDGCHRHDRLRVRQRRRRGHALRSLGLPGQTIRHGRAFHGAGSRRGLSCHRHRHPPGSAVLERWKSSIASSPRSPKALTRC